MYKVIYKLVNQANFRKRLGLAHWIPARYGVEYCCGQSFFILDFSLASCFSQLILVHIKEINHGIHLANTLFRSGNDINWTVRLKQHSRYLWTWNLLVFNPCKSWKVMISWKIMISWKNVISCVIITLKGNGYQRKATCFDWILLLSAC